MPRVVVEVADPVPLSVSVVESCRGNEGMVSDVIPPQIASFFKGCFTDCHQGTKKVFATIGLFALIRIERPAQLIIPACDFCIPDSDKSPISVTDPCALFKSIPFPINEFYPSTCSNPCPTQNAEQSNC